MGRQTIYPTPDGLNFAGLQKLMGPTSIVGPKLGTEGKDVYNLLRGQYLRDGHSVVIRDSQLPRELKPEKDYTLRPEAREDVEKIYLVKEGRIIGEFHNGRPYLYSNVVRDTTNYEPVQKTERGSIQNGHSNVESLDVLVEPSPESVTNNSHQKDMPKKIGNGFYYRLRKGVAALLIPAYFSLPIPALANDNPSGETPVSDPAIITQLNFETERIEPSYNPYIQKLLEAADPSPRPKVNYSISWGIKPEELTLGNVLLHGWEPFQRLNKDRYNAEAARRIQEILCDDRGIYIAFEKSGVSEQKPNVAANMYFGGCIDHDQQGIGKSLEQLTNEQKGLVLRELDVVLKDSVPGYKVRSYTDKGLSPKVLGRTLKVFDWGYQAVLTYFGVRILIKAFTPSRWHGHPAPASSSAATIPGKPLGK